MGKGERGTDREVESPQGLLHLHGVTDGLELRRNTSVRGKEGMFGCTRSADAHEKIELGLGKDEECGDEGSNAIRRGKSVSAVGDRDGGDPVRLVSVSSHLTDEG